MRFKPLVLAKSKGEGLNAWVQKLDFKRMVGDRSLLSHQLIKPLLCHDAVAIGIDVRAVVRTGLSAVDRDRESNRMSVV
jgi:hypothetical protein